MSDRDLERRLRGWYADAIDERETAPQELRRRVATIPASTPRRLGRLSGRGRYTLLAVAALLLIGGTLAAGAGLVRLAQQVEPSPPTALLATTQPSPSTPVSPSPGAAQGSPGPSPTASPATPTPIASLAPGFSWTGSQVIQTDGPSGETITRLADGRVLVTQNCGTEAELFDPATSSFSRTGSMNVPRLGGTATLLADGSVLVTGGYNCGSAGHDGTWASAERYDPATGRFAATGSMTLPREFHTATLLRDGRVLITGGITGPRPRGADVVSLASARMVDTTSSLRTAEIYNPVTGTFTRTGSMTRARLNQTATLLEDGRVLVAGGGGGETGRDDRTAELYDPASGTFTRTGSMHSGRYLHTATLLQDGRVLVAGGRTAKDSVRRSAETYDPRAGTFSLTGSLREGRQEQAATLLPDGRVFIAGGYWSDGHRWRVLSSTEIYDPISGEFTSAGSMGEPRDDPSATLLDDGRVLIVGGTQDGPEGAVGVASSVLFQP